MHITLCTGLFRSGSTWSYNVCRELAKSTSDTAVNFPIFDSHLPIDEYIEDNIFSEGYSCIKVHMPGKVAMNHIKAGSVYNVCTYRDPRDCVVSYYYLKKLSINHCVSAILKNLQYIDYYYEVGNTLFIPYEKLWDKPLKEIIAIAKFLNINIDEAQAKQIADLTSFERMQEIQVSLQKRKTVNEPIIDEDTRIFDNHIQSAKAGRWKTELSPQTATELTKIFRKWIDRWGYASCADDL